MTMNTLVTVLKNRGKITTDEWDTPIAVLEMHGCPNAIINFLEVYANVIYLGQIAHWRDADFLEVKNVGQVSIDSYRDALRKYLKGDAPLPNYAGADTSLVRDEHWVSRSGVKHVPWTLEEYIRRNTGIVPDDDSNSESFDDDDSAAVEAAMEAIKLAREYRNTGTVPSGTTCRE